MKLLNKLINKLKLPRFTDNCIETMKQLNTPPPIKDDINYNGPLWAVYKRPSNDIAKKADCSLRGDVGRFFNGEPAIHIDNKEIKKENEK